LRLRKAVGMRNMVPGSLSQFEGKTVKKKGEKQ
jgi:hypothetical protein